MNKTNRKHVKLVFFLLFFIKSKAILFNSKPKHINISLNVFPNVMVNMYGMGSCLYRLNVT